MCMQYGPEHHDAATSIQAGFRGSKARKHTESLRQQRAIESAEVIAAVDSAPILQLAPAHNGHASTRDSTTTPPPPSKPPIEDTPSAKPLTETNSP